jgi:hypothetical protein
VQGPLKCFHKIGNIYLLHRVSKSSERPGSPTALRSAGVHTEQPPLLLWSHFRDGAAISCVNLYGAGTLHGGRWSAIGPSLLSAKPEGLSLGSHRDKLSGLPRLTTLNCTLPYFATFRLFLTGGSCTYVRINVHCKCISSEGTEGLVQWLKQ